MHNLQKLRHLDLSGNLLHDLSALTDLKLLRYLDISNNPMIESLEALTYLPSLQHLHLQDCAQSSIQALNGLSELRTLNVMRNRLSDLGAACSVISGLRLLQSLILKGNSQC